MVCKRLIADSVYVPTSQLFISRYLTTRGRVFCLFYTAYCYQEALIGKNNFNLGLEVCIKFFLDNHTFKNEFS